MGDATSREVVQVMTFQFRFPAGAKVLAYR